MLYNVIITYEYNVIIKVTILKSYFETFMFGETIFWHLFPLPYNLIVAIFRRDQLWNPYYWENRIALQKEVVGGGGLNTHTLDRQESILATWLPRLPACIVMHVVISCQIYLFMKGLGMEEEGKNPLRPLTLLLAESWNIHFHMAKRCCHLDVTGSNPFVANIAFCLYVASCVP